MSIGDRLARWRAHRKLGRNRCASCGRPLPDDMPTSALVRGTCSAACAQVYAEDEELWRRV